MAISKTNTSANEVENGSGPDTQVAQIGGSASWGPTNSGQRVCYTMCHARAEFDEERALDTERFAGTTPELRLRLFLELCDLTDAIQRGRPDVHRLRAGTPLGPEAELLWQRLIRQARDG
jgi:hypothetical protein